MFKDFYFVLKYVQDFITGHDILRLYQELADSVTQIQAAPAEEVETLEQQIEDKKKEINEAHGNLNLLVWTPPQKVILKHIGAFRIMGKRATRYLEDLFNRGTGSQKGIVEGIGQLRNDTNELNSRVQQLLTNLALDEYKDEIPEGRSRIEITFSKAAAFKNFWEINSRTKEWNFIFKAFSDLTGENFEDIETISLNSACPDVGVWLEMGQKTVNAIIKAGGVVSALKTIKDTIFKKKKILKEEVGLSGKELKMSFKQVEVKHGKDYELKIGEATIELKQDYGQNNRRPQGDGDNQIALALGKMVDLLKDGSKVIDPTEVTPIRNEDGEKGLIEAYKENYDLEKGIKGYLEVEQQKRLVARTKTMKRELQLENGNPTLSWKKEQIKKYLKQKGIDTTGTKQAMIDRYNKSQNQNSGEEEKATEATSDDAESK